jgi:hypothetical protein
MSELEDDEVFDEVLVVCCCGRKALGCWCQMPLTRCLLYVVVEGKLLDVGARGL